MTDGRGAEKRAKEVYEQAGYEVYLPPLAKYREQDVFGLFDLLCYRRGALVGVQVKASRHARGINDWMDAARPYQEHVGGLYVEFLHSHKGGARRTPTSSRRRISRGRAVPRRQAARSHRRYACGEQLLPPAERARKPAARHR